MKTLLIAALFLAAVMEEPEPAIEDMPKRPSAVMSDEDQKIIKAERERVLGELEADIRSAEAARKAASKSKNQADLKRARDNLAFARKQLKAYKEMSDDYWLDSAKKRMDREVLANAAAAERRTKKPLVVEGMSLKQNVIGLPELVMHVRNQSGQRVEAFTINAECFNKFDEEIRDITGTNVFSGIAQSGIDNGGTDRFSWQLSLHRNAAYVKVWITRARFSDGTEWKQTKEQAATNGGYFRATRD